MIVRRRLFFLLVFIYSPQVAAQQQGSMLGDFFSSAISVFKPLVEERRSHIREQSTFVRPMLDSQRDVRVMGAPARTPMNDAVPICNGDGKLCAFIACQAENFKNDQTFANLNLAAQVMADKKLRHQVGNNPEAINAVCVDSGMEESRCGTFTKGFQMISKLINSLEEPIDNMQQRMPVGPAMQSNAFNQALSPQSNAFNSGLSRQSNAFNSGLSPIDNGGMESVPSGRMDQLPEPIINSRTMQPGRQQLMQLPLQQDDAVFGHPPVIRRMDDLDFSWASPRGMPSPQGMPSWSSSSSSSSSSSGQQSSWGANSDSAPSRAFGSQTWSSSKGEAINPAQTESPLERNDFLASFTPLPPTAAPLAFPTVKSVLPSMEDLFLRPFRMDPALEKMLMPIKIEPILRHRRHTDDFVRVVEHLARRSPSKIAAGVEKEEEESRSRVKRAEDYYDQADNEDTRSARPSSRGGQGGSSRGGGGGGGGNAPDYYDQVETGKEGRHRNNRPGRPKTQRNCFELLG